MTSHLPHVRQESAFDMSRLDDVTRRRFIKWVDATMQAASPSFL